ncbi:biosynthetic-type acetolactate synthase large subunit [Candidatus Calescamantes bacterium]|nr:biosynthetic-type acetolactate synthase large subunit [Candidatus Calescamantes bacterium]
MKESGAKILVECLLREGVEVIFGIPGGAILPICDVLYDAPIKFILHGHEQGAVHAADGYARATGKPGVCLATSGPGATNLVTGLATAYMDSVPLVAITGQVPTSMIGNDAFQEAPITEVTKTITKHNYLVKNVEELAEIVRAAFYIASTGRPGPVLIDIPKDIQIKETKFSYPEKIELQGYKPVYQGHPKQIEKAVKFISTSKKPLIFIGGGVIISGAHKEIIKLVEKTKIPVTSTLMGLGGFPGTHPLFLGMLGMHGTRAANYAIMESDLIIGIGVRFDDRATGKLENFAPHAKIIHIDIDPTSIQKNVKVDVPIVGDIKNVLESLLPLTKPPQIKEWLEKVKKWNKEFPLTYPEDDTLRPQYVVEKIYEVTKGEAIITTEVGQNQMWAAQFYKFTHPRTLLTSGGLGTMGYGFPAAIGAQVAFPEKIIFDIAGDGSIQMNIQELKTATSYNLPVKIAILNNAYLGMVRQWQELFYERRYAMTDLSKNPDFVRIAEAYGAVGLRVKKKEEVIPTLEKALQIPKCVLIDFQVNREENVFPMVPAGESLKQMIGGMA